MRSALVVSCVVVLAACAAAPVAKPSTAPVASSASPVVSVIATPPSAEPPPVQAPPVQAPPLDPRIEAAAHAIENGDAAGAKKSLESVLIDLGAGGPFDARIIAHVILGRACDALGDHAGADRAFQWSADSWRDPQKAIASILETPASDDRVQLKRVGRSLVAVGESLFHFAEKKRDWAEVLRPPPAMTTAGRTAWLAERRARTEAAERAYVAILELEPAPPPKWVILSAASTAEMWARFADAFRAGPAPSGVSADAFREAVAEAAVPLDERARGAFKSCADLSVKLQAETATGLSCRAWVDTHPR